MLNTAGTHFFHPCWIVVCKSVAASSSTKRAITDHRKSHCAGDKDLIRNVCVLYGGIFFLTSNMQEPIYGTAAISPDFTRENGTGNSIAYRYAVLSVLLWDPFG